jgi:hypothetical protein
LTIASTSESTAEGCQPLTDEEWPETGFVSGNGPGEMSLIDVLVRGISLVRGLLWISDFRFQISDFRFQISDFRFQISDFRFQISDFRFQISDIGFQISDFR